MSKILLERAEWERINDILQHYKGINHCEIEVESISGIGKATKLIVPHHDFFDESQSVYGQFVITITDENDW